MTSTNTILRRHQTGDALTIRKNKSAYLVETGDPLWVRRRLNNGDTYQGVK